MDARITRMAKVLGIPLASPRWKEGDAWWDDPVIFRMLCRIAAVMEYVEAEFGIEDDTEREQLHIFIRDLHHAFCYRLDRGAKLEDISFPPEILADYEADFHGRFPSAILVERLRKQFHDY